MIASTVTTLLQTTSAKAATRNQTAPPEKPKPSSTLSAPLSRFLAATLFALLFSLIFTQSVTAQTITIDDRTVAVGSSIEINLDEVFSPDVGSSLTYEATTSVEGRVTAEVDGSILTVTGVAAGPGSVQIAVTASDGRVVAFQVTVTASAPVITAINTVPNRASEAGIICITFDGDVKFGTSTSSSFVTEKLGDFALSSDASPALTVTEFGGHCLVDGRTRNNAIHLTLNRQIVHGEKVTLSYTKSENEHNEHDTKGIRRDGGSKPLADFSDKRITNNAIAPIEGLELVLAGTFSANQIFLSFGLEIVTTSSDPRPGAADFTVSGAASSPTVTGISGSSSPSALLLTLDANIVGGETITLSYAKTTGSITGTTSREELKSFTDYSVTNTRPAPAPAPVTAPSISISQATVTATVGTAIAPITIASTGGTVASYSIEPALPAGLTLDTTTGTISGTPTAVSASTNYTITATNTGGMDTAMVNITVNAAPIAAPIQIISDQTVAVGSSIEIDLDEAFSPPADSPLTYTATTTAMGIVKVSVDGSMLTVTGLAAGPGGGSIQIAVTPSGGQVVTFQVTVTASTEAPAITAAGITAINTVLNRASEAGIICITFDGDVTFDGSPNASFLNERLTDFALSSDASPALTVTKFGGRCFVDTGTRSNTIQLTLNRKIAFGETVTLSYTKTGDEHDTKGIRKVVGGAVLADFSNQPVMNNAIQGLDLRSAETFTQANKILLTFGIERVTTSSDLRAADFMVSGAASNPVVTGISNKNVRDGDLGSSALVLTLSKNIVGGEDILLSYTKTAGSFIRGHTEGELANFDNYSVTNHRPLPPLPVISISAATVTATAGTAIADITITSTGGAVARYSINPAIGNGLSFDTTTGTISGTPTAAATEIIYTITATNTAGTATATVAITVNAAADTTAPITVTDGSDAPADTTAPIITLTGDNPQTIEQDAGYTELGATTDDGSTVSIDSSTFVDAVGTYAITYTATDGINQATPVTRTVNVVDTTAPTVTISTTSQTVNTAAFTLKGTTETGATVDVLKDGTSIGAASVTGTSWSKTLTLTNGANTFTATASDSLGNTSDATDAVSITLDTAPSFGTAAIPHQTYTAGTAIPALTLPAASGGNGALTYSLTPSLPRGLTFDTASRTISGTADAETASTSYTYIAADSDTNTAATDTARLTFSITVLADGLSEEDIQQLNLAIMPRLTQALVASSAASVERRVDSAFASAETAASYQLDGHQIQFDSQTTLTEKLTGGLLQKLAGYGRSHRDGNINWKQMLSNSSFLIPLHSADQAGANQASAANSGLVVWGSGDYSRLSENDPGLDWQGDLTSLQLGLDKRLDSLLLGGMVTWSEGDVDYTLEGDKGTYNHKMTSIHPYLAWNNARADLWGSIGYGQGDLTIKHQKNAQEDNTHSTDTNLLSLAAGIKGQLISGLSLKSDLLLARTDINAAADVNIAKQTIDSQRLRLLLEIAGQYTLASGSTIKPVLEIGARYDGGDGNSGTGAVLGAGMRYANLAGLTLEGNLHALVGQGNYKEWGIQALISLDPGTDQLGLAFSLRPGYGYNGSSSDTSALWQQNLSQSNLHNSATDYSATDYGARLGANLSYGLLAPGQVGLLTPYSEITLGAINSYRLGIRWQGASRFDLHLFGEHRESSGHLEGSRGTDQAIQLEGTVHF